jgi:hypothetical protein
VVVCRVPVALPKEQSVAAQKKSTFLPSPTLRNILLQDLKDTGRLLDLYAQATQAEIMSGSEAERLTFVGLAQHVLACHPENVGGLFRQLLTRRCFHFVTQEDEDAAHQRLKQHLYAVKAGPILQTPDPDGWSGIQRVAA